MCFNLFLFMGNIFSMEESKIKRHESRILSLSVYTLTPYQPLNKEVFRVHLPCSRLIGV